MWQFFLSGEVSWLLDKLAAQSFFFSFSLYGLWFNTNSWLKSSVRDSGFINWLLVYCVKWLIFLL